MELHQIEEMDMELLDELDDMLLPETHSDLVAFPVSFCFRVYVSSRCSLHTHHTHHSLQSLCVCRSLVFTDILFVLWLSIRMHP
jgi:hypothetical protein